MTGDVCNRLREFADRYPEVEADLVSGPDDGGEPRGVTVVVRREALRAYTTGRIHVLRELETVRRPVGHAEDVPPGPDDERTSP